MRHKNPKVFMKLLSDSKRLSRLITVESSATLKNSLLNLYSLPVVGLQLLTQLECWQFLMTHISENSDVIHISSASSFALHSVSLNPFF
jgi:hypothetical protein